MRDSEVVKTDAVGRTGKGLDHEANHQELDDEDEVLLHKEDLRR